MAMMVMMLGVLDVGHRPTPLMVCLNNSENIPALEG